MSRQLQIASKWEMRAVIRFWCAKMCNCTEIYGQLHEVYGENAMSRQAIAKWCTMFENGRTDIEDAEYEGRPSTATISEIAARVNECKLANRRITIDEISNELDITHGICARWVPRLLTEEHEGKGFERAFAFLQSYQTERNEFLDKIVTGDETWIHHFSPETKSSSLEWKHYSSPTRTKCRTVPSAGK
ncbi:histone-lysine N-methyltransferase SETMAR-like, partial [Stegodyphus dumicola]|uniref:histone-lysine N-methyltransferase SETMAR-like n=1 Tax=Stegodyphus dumicola TaxID=202533 RepID=UPI0015AB3B87